MHKLKKKTKKKIKLGSLYLITCFSLICITCFDLSIEKENEFMISSNEKIFHNVSSSELLNIIKKGNGVVVLIDNKKTTNKIINLLYKNKNNNNIYVYNLINDETILRLNDNEEIEIEKQPTKFYNKLLDSLGLFKEEYNFITEDKRIIETGYYKIYTPMVLFIKDGKILFSYSILNEEITDEELLVIYEKGYNALATTESV